MKRTILFSFILLGAVYCSRPKDEPVPNQPPETYLFVERIDIPVGGKQVFHWYGNDVDGEVVGFYVAVDDTTNKDYTTERSDTFYFSAGDSIAPHLFCVWAVDNENAIDPTPACIDFLVRNTPPTLNFVGGTLPPDTTLPVSTFYLEFHDDDGDETIMGVEYRLDYESSWHRILKDSITGLVPSEITLDSIQSGSRTVFFRVFDEVGAYSDSISYSWTVIPVVGDILLVDDAGLYDGDVYIQGIGGRQFTYWNLYDNPLNSPKDRNYVINSLGFRTIIWFTDNRRTYLDRYFSYLQTFLDNGNKLIIISPNISNVAVDTLYGGFVPLFRTYADVDTVYYKDKTIYNGNAVYENAQYARAEVSGYPNPLEPSVRPIMAAYADGVLVRDSAQVLYTLQDTTCNRFTWNYNPADSTCSLPQPVVGWKRESGYKLYIFTIPLHQMDYNGNVDDLIDLILSE